MYYDSKRGHHTKLVLKMADTQDVDLAELVMRAEVSAEEVESAVDRCVGCTQPTACAALLDSQEMSVTVPDYCRNAGMFDRLKAL